MENMNQNNEGKIKRVLYNEVSLSIAIVSLVSGLIFWVTNPGIILSQRVSVLEQDVTHQGEIYENEEKYQSDTLFEIKSRVKAIEDRQLDMIESLARMENRK